MFLRLSHILLLLMMMGQKKYTTQMEQVLKYKL